MYVVIIYYYPNHELHIAMNQNVALDRAWISYILLWLFLGSFRNVRISSIAIRTEYLQSKKYNISVTAFRQIEVENLLQISIEAGLKC